MPQYQNYYANQQMNNLQNQQMNPYGQSMYGNYQPYQSQSMFQQTQPQVQPQVQNIGLIGKYVSDFGIEQITASDIPTNGTYATFIKNDLSEIQLRSWNGDGNVSKLSFMRVCDENENKANNQSNTLNSLNDDMRAFREEINARFDKLEKSIGSKSTSSRAKKEVVADE